MEYGLRPDQLQTICTYFAKYPEIETAVLFGSRALGTYKLGSDVDLALKGDAVTIFTAARLKAEIEEETVIPYFFDIVAYPLLSHRDFITHIDMCGKIIYAKR
ncbi:MAG: nucleotidyltransferase domain-containing protein [Thermoguttaceae bacterium]